MPISDKYLKVAYCHDIAQAVSHRPVSAENWVQSQAIPLGIFGQIFSWDRLMS